jgi:uncharacterized membrane protein
MNTTVLLTARIRRPRPVTKRHRDATIARVAHITSSLLWALTVLTLFIAAAAVAAEKVRAAATTTTTITTTRTQ